MNPRVLLVTGGIGSGKSVIVRLFNTLGVPSYDCDASAKLLYDRDPQLLADVVALSGSGVLSPDGRLDRAALAGRIFADPALRAAVEERVHPAVIRDFLRWKAERTADVVVIESAILLEKPLYSTLYDYVAAVSAPEKVRLARIVRRDGCSEEEARRRMSAQWSDAQRAAHADFILENNDRQALLPAAMTILDKIQEDGKN